MTPKRIIAAIIVISTMGSPAVATPSPFVADGTDVSVPPEAATGVCVWEHCLSERQLTVGGIVAGGTAASAAAVGHAAGTEAALAAAGGLLLFGHVLFDVVPLAIAGGVAYFSGFQVWQWFGNGTE